MNVLITSGYYNPIHRGHVEYLEIVKAFGGHHVAIVNNDAQAIAKCGTAIPQEDRLAVVGALRCVDEVLLSIDTDVSVCASIAHIAAKFPQHHIIFCKGGDRTADNIPEVEACALLDITIQHGFGAKVQSSSVLRETCAGAHSIEKQKPAE